jgi:hypothetical protein
MILEKNFLGIRTESLERFGAIKCWTPFQVPVDLLDQSRQVVSKKFFFFSF